MKVQGVFARWVHGAGWAGSCASFPFHLALSKAPYSVVYGAGGDGDCETSQWIAEHRVGSCLHRFDSSAAALKCAQ